jgi:para-nitrobenzyl esterase
MMALNWIHENIAAFGGDPDNITVFGQSAGGMSTRMLMTSPLSKNLFQHAIVESGGGVNEGDPFRKKEEFAEICTETMHRLGWTAEDLLNRGEWEICVKMNDMAAEVINHESIAFFQPFLDEHVLYEAPGVNIRRGNYGDVDVICGTVDGDSMMFQRAVADQLPKDPKIYRAFSFVPEKAWAESNIETGRKSIYCYYFEHTQPERDYGFPTGGGKAPHTAEIAYVMGTLHVIEPNVKWTEFDEYLAKTIQTYWTNFARTGNPNGKNLPEWKAYTAECPQIMHFADDEIESKILADDSVSEKVVRYTLLHPGYLSTLEEFDKA